MSRYHSRRLNDGYLYLVLDQITLKVKGATGVRKRLVLCAYASGGTIVSQFKALTLDWKAAILRTTMHRCISM